MSGDHQRLEQAKGLWASRGRIVIVEVLVFLLALGGMAVSATACEGVGGPELTTLTTSLSGEGKEGTTITVLEGSKVKDKATLKGKNASSATGKVTYKVYSESECKTLVKEAGEVTVSGESVPASSEVELEGGATYYWQAHYSGDSKNGESTSECTEMVTVKAKTSLSTKLSGESKEGEELTILEGSKAKDKATLSGTKSSSAGGKVVYKVYSDDKCEHLVKEAGEVTVSSGSVPASSEEELEGGKTYYWQAHYDGDSLHQESSSTCGSEVLNVKAKTSLSTELDSESEEAEEGEELTELADSKTTDKATLSGTNSSSAGGKAVYKLYSGSECKTLDKEVDEVTVSSGSVPASSEEELTTPGTYSWLVAYKGDPLHQESTSPCKVENIKARQVWEVEVGGTKVKLYAVAPPGSHERALATAATVSGFQLKTAAGSGPQITIKCGAVATNNGSIKERIEMNTEFVFSSCTVVTPANCEIKEGATAGQITFKSLEGRLNDEEVIFRESKIGTPVASFEVASVAPNTCSERGTIKLTGGRLRAFTALISNFETTEVAKKIRLSSESAHSPIVFSLTYKNERTSGVIQAELEGEIGLQLAAAGEMWATTPE